MNSPRLKPRNLKSGTHSSWRCLKKNACELVSQAA